MYNLSQLALVVRSHLSSSKRSFCAFQTDIMNECPTPIFFAQQLTHIELVDPFRERERRFSLSLLLLFRIDWNLWVLRNWFNISSWSSPRKKLVLIRVFRVMLFTIKSRPSVSKHTFNGSIVWHSSWRPKSSNTLNDVLVFDWSIISSTPPTSVVVYIISTRWSAFSVNDLEDIRARNWSPPTSFSSSRSSRWIEHATSTTIKENSNVRLSVLWRERMICGSSGRRSRERNSINLNSTSMCRRTSRRIVWFSKQRSTMPRNIDGQTIRSSFPSPVSSCKMFTFSRLTVKITPVQKESISKFVSLSLRLLVFIRSSPRNIIPWPNSSRKNSFFVNRVKWETLDGQFSANLFSSWLVLVWTQWRDHQLYHYISDIQRGL